MSQLLVANMFLILGVSLHLLVLTAEAGACCNGIELGGVLLDGAHLVVLYITWQVQQLQLLSAQEQALKAALNASKSVQGVLPPTRDMTKGLT